MNYLIFIFLLLLSPAAYSFPIAEGVSALSTLLGVLTSIIVGVAPTLGTRSVSRKSITISIFLFLSLLFSLGYIYHLNSSQQLRIETGLQSRPTLINNSILENTSFAFSIPVQNIALYHNSNPELPISISDYYSFNNPSHIFYLDYIPDSLRQQPFLPNVSLINMNKEDYLEGIIQQLSTDTNSHYILSSSDSVKSAYVSLLLFKKTGKKTPYFINYAYQSREDSIPYIQHTDPFSLNLVDLRSLEDIKQSHTIYGSINYSVSDLYHMTDKQIIEQLGSNRVFTSFYESDYLLTHARLSRVPGLTYFFMEGGLNSHFNTHSITPFYLSMSRLLTPNWLMKEYSRHKDIKFICSDTQYCLPNIPKEDTFFVSVNHKNPYSLIEQVSHLPDNYRYVLLSYDQITDGNSLLIGYTLFNQGKHLLGTLGDPQGFSLEYIRHHIINDDSITLDAFRDSSYKLFPNSISTQIKTDNIILVFFSIGILFRLGLFVFQRNIFTCYYKEFPMIGQTLLSSFIVVGGIVGAFYFFNNTLLNYPIISLHDLQSLNNSRTHFLLSISFTVMVIMQSFITFPTRKYFAICISIIIIYIYTMGYIEIINSPVLSFLTASELVSIIMQFPFYLNFLRAKTLGDKGIYISTYKGISHNLPSKWFMLNKWVETKGALVDIKKVREANLLSYEHLSFAIGDVHTYIIRSCDSDEKEQVLAGYNTSIICDRNNLTRHLQDIQDDYVWIQPYLHYGRNGVAQSYTGHNKEALVVYGNSLDSATEGNKDVDIQYITRTFIQNPIIYTLRNLEKLEGSPLIMEFNEFNGEVTVHQIRTQADESAETNSLLVDYSLFEGYLAQSSHLTGSLLQHISRNTIYHHFGFNYIKKKNNHFGTVIGSDKTLSCIDSKLNLYWQNLNTDKPSNPYFLLTTIESLINQYRLLYLQTQPLFSFSDFGLYRMTHYFTLLSGNELDVASPRIHCPISTSYTQSRREYIHHLLVTTTGLLYFYVHQYYLLSHLPLLGISFSDINISLLLSNSNQTDIAYYNKSPLNHNTVNRNILSSGKIEGIIILIDKDTDIEQTVNSLDINTSYILAGVEIGSQWVKYLHLFSGIISIYGHTASHLAISSRAIGIPYQLVSQLPNLGDYYTE